MYQQEPNYQEYTSEELEDVLANIDQSRFPERYKQARTALQNKLVEGETLQGDTLVSLSIELEPAPKKLKRLQPLLYLLMALFAAPILNNLYFEAFITSQQWYDKSLQISLWIGLPLTALVYYFMFTDNWYSRNMAKQKPHKQVLSGLTPLFIWPLLFFMTTTSIPIVLHYLVDSNSLAHITRYEKTSASKYCHRRVKVRQVAGLTEDKLCLDTRLYNQLSSKGWLQLSGEQSQYGMRIEAILKSRRPG